MPTDFDEYHHGHGDRTYHDVVRWSRRLLEQLSPVVGDEVFYNSVDPLVAEVADAILRGPEAIAREEREAYSEQ